eukprot:TRINITY_DN1073_c0_g1_i9.p3 TRINITY_DN1073_c0_g1~~TRINITY_DN1073_c0_g1_i9.p3  ORF type:complete len:159 (+),score=9.79 TRINITY_DN1073_c0_g1_i9:114-590(+)
MSKTLVVAFLLLATLSQVSGSRMLLDGEEQDSSQSVFHEEKVDNNQYLCRLNNCTVSNQFSGNYDVAKAPTWWGYGTTISVWSPWLRRRLQQTSEGCASASEFILNLPACCQVYTVPKDNTQVCDIAHKYEIECYRLKAFNDYYEDIVNAGSTLQVCA